MSRYLRKISFFAVALFSLQGFGNTSSRSFQKGFFGIGPSFGYSNVSLTNSSGLDTAFNGFSYGLQLEISLTRADEGDIALYGQWSQGQFRDKDSTTRLDSSSLLVGLRFYSNRYIFLQGGYGNIDQSLSSQGIKTKFENRGLSVGLGIQYPWDESLAIGFLTQYSVNPIRSNSSSQPNSFANAVEGMLTLTWSPPSTTITTIQRGR